MDLPLYSNEALALDVRKKEFQVLLGPFKGSNLGSTPLMANLDYDGSLDIIYSFMEDPGNFYSFKETRMERMELQVSKKDSIIWGTYMGQNYDGIYNPAD